MKHLRTLSRGVAEAAALLLLVSALQACSGCASAQVKRTAYDTLSTTQTVLQAAQALEIAQVCGRPTAQPEPLCVPLEKHHEIQGWFLEGANIGQEITALVRKASAEGTPVPQRAWDLALDLKHLADRILAALPKSGETARLQAQLEGN